MLRERIVVVQIGKIGDMILTTPLLRKLKKVRPQSDLVVLSSPKNSIIAKHCPSVDKVLEFTKNPLNDLKLFRSELHHADIWIDPKPEYSSTSGQLLKFMKPVESVGYSTDKLQFGFNMTERKSGEHYTDICLAALSYFSAGYEPLDRLPHLEISGNYSNTWKKDGTDTRVLVNISAGKPGRKLPLETWQKLIGEITSVYKVEVVLISDICDASEALRIADLTRSSYKSTKTIIEAARCVKESDITISPDTSIVHLCSAFNKPVLALYPNVEWNLNRFAPLSEHFEVLISEEDDSLEKIKPLEIVEAFGRLYSCCFSGNAESRTRVRKEDH